MKYLLAILLTPLAVQTWMEGSFFPVFGGTTVLMTILYLAWPRYTIR